MQPFCAQAETSCWIFVIGAIRLARRDRLLEDRRSPSKFGHSKALTPPPPPPSPLAGAPQASTAAASILAAHFSSRTSRAGYTHAVDNGECVGMHFLSKIALESVGGLSAGQYPPDDSQLNLCRSLVIRTRRSDGSRLRALCRLLLSGLVCR